MVKWMVMLALATGQAPPPGAPAVAPEAPPPAAAPASPAPEGAQAEARKRADEVKEALGPQAQPFPANGNVASLGGVPIGKLLLLPDIAAIVDGAFGYTTLSQAQQDPYDPALPTHKVWPILQEVELALQATVDPYVRGDIFLTFGPEGVEVEEAYLLTLSLPWDLQVKAGKLYAPFGRTSQLHRHQWIFADQPVSMQRLVGPEGLNGAGADVAWLAPLPWFAELHVAYQATAPGFGMPLQATATGRLVQFFDVAEGATMGVGLSWSFFLADAAGQWRNLAGADLYLKLRDPASRSYWVVQAELYGRQLDGSSFSDARWGGYGQAVWRIDRSWEVGARYDNAPAPAAYAGGTQHTVTALGTYYTSDFLRIRLQPSAILLPGGQSGFQALANFEFTIGAHGAHPF
jgi:hypothetical protein